MSIAEEYRNQIINEFKEDYQDNYEGDFETFQESYIEEQYNSYNSYPFNQQYNHLVYFLGVVKENDEGNFKEWDNPQKVYELGMYFLAREYIMELKQEDMPLTKEQLNKCLEYALTNKDYENEHLNSYYKKVILPKE